ncbi:CopG family transcriptional regulator [Leptolyngbya cf. ectocarpi LEGE 11479]|uniref:CopG family transcriptional regulator n=1 Tax=Leptolyngbya cf. ectocarpi LEGE 11479 TaxID=1828722 RepID=A0A929A0J3_LEPEC|nr:CopG family transcriptional regulator [Leptolyngbya ectocarpi]MBE9070840.1 CopG family transcriptional regulator [Leptolyngbya cf. ectocarpi LEGE 11479]
MPLSAKTDAEPFDTTEQISPAATSKPRRGRPPTLTDESQRRKRRNVSISDNAWNHLEKLVVKLGYSSKSELLELIGKGELVVTKPTAHSPSSSLSEILVYRRLQGLFAPHSDVLHSLFAFNSAIYQKIEPLQSHPFRKLMVNDLIASMSVVFQHCYIRPDRYVNSLSALSRLINYCLLLNQADLENAWQLNPKNNFLDRDPLHESSSRDCLAKIGSAMSHLSTASFSLQFTALRLKYISGFTEAQIQQIYELQGMDFTIEDIRRLVHEGWTKFRKHRNKPSKIETPMASVVIPPEAAKYCDLLWTSSLTQARDRHALLRILVKATYHAPLNFWLCEIEHEWGAHVLGYSPEQAKEWAQLQASIQRHLSEKLQVSKDTIDKEMHYCLSRTEAVENLAAIFEKETGISSTTELGQFMIRLLQGEAEEKFALAELKKLRRSGHELS